MRRRIAAIATAFVMFCGIFLCGCGNNSTSEGQILRLHIRANSNSAADQAVKLKVRDAVVAYLEPRLSGANDVAEAKALAIGLTAELRRIGEEVLAAEGFGYGATARVCNEFFPTRMYDSLVVESGYYDALIIELGDGEGDNWWCVVYPPLCYLETTVGSGFRYKSKIKELIDKYFRLSFY